MNNKYIPSILELKVQKYWEKTNTFAVTEDSNKKKFYCLPMLPYPSGILHMGHVRNYTISDVISRYQRMLGKNVLQPIGWDAFGLPAEEAAIQNNISPEKWTKYNIKVMKKQLKSLGFSFDWKREIVTCDPKYYKWEQIFFIKLYKKKIIYKKKTLVNWCPNDKTVLANEQVQNGVCWRCNTPIILKYKSQWFLKITKYANKLLKDLKLLKYWPKEVIKMQKNWIGKSNGLEITCQIYHSKYVLKFFTTKPETIIGVTFFVISMHHPLIKKLFKENKIIKKFLEENVNNPISNLENVNKIVGINTQLFIIHPITKKKIQLWISNYIKHDYATGAIMAVPGHNKKDLEFAKKYKINIKTIFLKKYVNIFYQKKKYKEIQLINSNVFNGLSISEASYIISKKLIDEKIAIKKTYFKIKDWCISRQRYWGVPIPMGKNSLNQIISVPKKNIPIILNKNIYQNKKINTNVNSQKITREKDTLDTFLQSSWYYARYTSYNCNNTMINKKLAKYWLPVDQYIGGIEHAVMHLIYFRFFHKLLKEFGYVQNAEPVKKLICQGMVIIDSFYFINESKLKIWIPLKELNIIRCSKGNILYGIHKDTGKKIEYAGKLKMSKSKKNGINPDDIVQKYGADTLRLFIMSAAPIEAVLEWNYSGIIGMYRFLNKLWYFIHNIKIEKNNFIKERSTEREKKTREYLNTTIKSVTNDIAYRYSYNTAISNIIKFFNFIKKNYKTEQYFTPILKKCIKTILKLLYPFAPHITFVLFQKISKKQNNIDKTNWPIINPKETNQEKNIIIIQINGKKKHILKIPYDISEKDIINTIFNNQKLRLYFNGKKIKKTIYIPNKIINFILY